MQLLKSYFHTLSRPEKSVYKLLSMLAFVTLLSVAVASCFYGSPDKPGTTTTVVVYPTSSGEMISDDQRVIVEFESGTVARPTTFSLTTIPAENYPDQYLLRSDVYQIEPAKKLLKPLKITVELADLDGENFTLSDAYNIDAIKLREMTPGASPTYLDAEETNIVDLSNRTHHVLIRETDTPGNFGIFVQGCYAMCLKRETCPTHDVGGETRTLRERILDCMERFDCTDFENLNSQENEDRFLCSYLKNCSYSFTCCLDDPPCTDISDGDTDQVTDGDDDTVIDGDDDQSEMEEDTEDTRFDLNTCVTRFDCPDTEMECVTSSMLNNSQTGYCIYVSDLVLRGYVYNDDSDQWVQQENDLITDCAGVGPLENASGDTTADIQILLEDWWTLSDPKDIKVELFMEDNLESPLHTGYTDANGEYLIDNSTAVDDWFVIRLSRESEDPSIEIVPTYTWGNFIDQTEAKNANQANGVVRIPVMGIDRNRWVKFAQFMNINEAELSGYGMVMGQVEDCRGTTRYKIKNASVGFLEATPINMGYFKVQAGLVPSTDITSTSENGLFAAIYLPPMKSLTAFAVGKKMAGDTKENYIIGLTISGHLKLFADSVSIVRFNAFH